MTRSLLLGLVVLGWLAGSSLAQNTSPTSLHSVRLPIEPVDGEIRLDARAGWIWMEGPTHRIVLERAVNVVLGGHRFMAQRANLWLSPLDDAGLYQVYGVFDDLIAPDGSMSLSGDELPVRGVIRTNQPISMRVDARFDHPPARKTEMDAFVVRTNQIFAERVLGIAPPAGEARPNPAEIFASMNDPENATPNPVAEEPAELREPVFRPRSAWSASGPGRS